MASQSELDADRRTFRLTFPSDLNEHDVNAWINSISSSTMHVGLSRIFAVPSIVFETIADGEGIYHRIRVPHSDAPYVVSHLESLVPGIHVEQERVANVPWTAGLVLNMSSPSRPLRIIDSGKLSNSILTAFQSLRDNEQLIFQWVLSPMPAERLPSKEQQSQSVEWSVTRSLMSKMSASSDEIDDRRRKLAVPNMFAVGRVAALAPHELRAKELVRGVLKSIGETSNGANRIIEKPIPTHKLIDAVNKASTPRMYKGQLNMTELVPLIAWPTGSPYVAGLPQSRTRHMHVNNAVPDGSNNETVIGESNVPGRHRNIGIEQIERMKHVHVVGPIGVGKTALLTSMVEQDMQNGLGVVLIETKGDLFNAALERIPVSRLDDVIVWDLDDTDYPLGFNVLRQSTSRSAVDELNALIQAMYPESGLMTTGPLYHGVHALAESPDGTFIDLTTMLNPTNEDEERWRHDLVKNIKSREIRKYWDRYLSNKPQAQDKDAQPLQRRMWEFTARSEIRNSLGQSESSFYMEDVVRDGKILLVNLNGVRIGQKTASLVGTLIMNSVWNAVRTTQHAKPVILYMDEFQNFVTMPTSPSDMLAQSRSFGLGMVLAHQHTGQLHNELREAVLANARSKVIFQTTASDARIMANEFGRQVKPEDFINLQFREAIARVATSTGVSQPFTMRTKDVSRPSANPRLVREMSRAKYGRPVEQVEAAIEARRSPPKTQRRRPPNSYEEQ